MNTSATSNPCFAFIRLSSPRLPERAYAVRSPDGFTWRTCSPPHGTPLRGALRRPASHAAGRYTNAELAELFSVAPLNRLPRPPARRPLCPADSFVNGRPITIGRPITHRRLVARKRAHRVDSRLQLG